MAAGPRREPLNCEPSLTSDIDPCSVVRGRPGVEDARRASSRRYLMSGSSLYWWNGGGDGSVHSSVVAPGPHGLSAAFCLRAKAWKTPKKKISAPSPD